MEIKRALVPVRGEPADEEAFRVACEMVQEARGTVYVLYVIEVARHLPVDAEVPSEAARGEEVLQSMEQMGKEYRCKVEAEMLQARESGPAIVQEAVAREAQLVVLGMPHRPRFGSFTLGETVPYVLKHAPCRVLVWREETPAHDRPTRGRGRAAV